MSDADEAEVEIPDKLFFRIGEAATLIGVETHVLRYWESEFKMRPQRSSSGQRMYRRKDIARFLRIRALLHDEGFTIAGARKALLDGGTETPGGGVDPGRVQEAIGRVTAIRQRIEALRTGYAESGIAPISGRG